MHERLDFDAGSFPGYVHRTTRADATTAGVKEKDKRHCKTFVFRRNPAGKPTEDAALAGWGIGGGGGSGAGVGSGGGAVGAGAGAGRVGGDAKIVGFSFMAPRMSSGGSDGGGLLMMAPRMGVPAARQARKEKSVPDNAIYFGEPGKGSGLEQTSSKKKKKQKQKQKQKKHTSKKKKGFGMIS